MDFTHRLAIWNNILGVKGLYFEERVFFTNLLVIEIRINNTVSFHCSPMAVLSALLDSPGDSRF